MLEPCVQGQTWFVPLLLQLSRGPSIRPGKAFWLPSLDDPLALPANGGFLCSTLS